MAGSHTSSNSTDDSVTTFAIGANGALQATAGTATQNTPRSMAISPNGLFVYVANYGSNDVEAYSINSDGSLSLFERAQSSSATSRRRSALIPAAASST